MQRATSCSNRLTRSSKQCRERWDNHLRQGLRKCPWSEKEDCMLIELHQKYGNKFVVMGEKLNRADIHIRNRIHSTKRMVVRHEAGCSTNGFRKEGALFVKFFSKKVFTLAAGEG